MLAVLFGAILNQSAQAQNNNFTNATSANWSAASAWSLGVPTSAQDAYHTNVTTGTVAINVTTSAQANSLTLGGSGGTATVTTFANQSLTVGGNITLASGAGTAELRLSGTNSTVTLNGGAGSIINGGGAGLATLNVQGGFSNSVGLLNASVDDLNMGQTGNGTLIITNGQTYNVSSLLRLNNSTASNNATILMNGGTLNYSGPNEIRLNSGVGAGNTAYLILNSNALVAATKIRRQNLGADAAIEWNDGTIGNYAGTNLTIDALAGTMNVKLAGTGTHTFEAESGRTITVAATAQLQDKSGENGTLNKTGGGTLLLQGANTYTGGTTIGGGTLLVATSGSIASSSLATVNNGGLLQVNGTAGAITVNSGGSLSGSGTNGLVTLNRGSLLNPGNSPGTLTVASATVLGGGGSTYNWEISALTGTPGTTWDLLSVTGLLNMSGVTSENRWNLVVTADGAFTGWNGTSEYSYVFAQAASVSGFSPTVGTDVTSLFNITASGITSLPNKDFNPNGDFKVVVGSANGLTTLNLMAIPEPSSGSMLGLGLAGLVVTRLLRRKGV